MSSKSTFRIPVLSSNFLRQFLFAVLVLTATTSATHAEPRTVTSIKPIHSLVAAVMKGVGTPDLIAEDAASPHSFALKPSQAKLLEKAELVFWVGPDIETFLVKPMDIIASSASVVSLMETPGLTLLPFREGGAFESHAHHEDEHHEEHEEHEEHAGHDDHDEHNHGDIDNHIWLDPENAKAMVESIAEALSSHDPDNRETYTANARAVNIRLNTLMEENSATLSSVKGKPFIVFHDAYQYFERRFDISATGTLTVNPDVSPSAERLDDIRHAIRKTGANCVFAEPQFTPKFLKVVTEGTSAKIGILDPLGADLEPGPDLYPELIRNMATSLQSCLKG